MRTKRADKATAGRHAAVDRRASSRPANLHGWLLAIVSALLVVTPLVPSEATVHLGAAAPLHLLWMFALLGWAGLLVLRPGATVVFGWTGVAAAVLIGLCVISALTVGLSGNGRQALNMMWQWISYGVAALLLRQLLTTPALCRALVVVVAMTAVVEATDGYYEYFVSGPAQRAEFQADPEAVYRQNGATTEAHRQQLRWRIESVEPLGTFGLTNSLAGLLAPWLIMLAGIGLSIAQRGSNWQALLGVALAAAIVAGCLVLTKSRTAVLAAAIGIVLVGLYGRTHGWRLDWKIPAVGAAAAVLIALAAIAVGGLDVEVVSEAPLSVLYRVQYWQSTAAMIADHPLLGVGPGNFQEYYARYALPQASEIVADPHNFLLEVWATTGTPALVALLALAVAFVWQLSKGRSLDSSTPHEAGSLDQRSPAEPAGPTREPAGATGRVWIYMGAIAGLAAGYPLALVPGYSPENLGIPAIWLVGLPIAAACVWLLDGWVVEGHMPTAVPVIGLVVLLVNLLAAGAASFPGVFGTAWILLAVALANADAPAWRWRAERREALAGALAAAVFAVACIRTDFSPVIISTTQVDEGRLLQQAGQVAQADEVFSAAAVADPWSPTPWHALADLRLQRWLQTQRQPDLAALEEAAAGFVARNSRHHTAYEALGDWWLIVWRKSGDGRYLPRAIQAYEQAVAWYPNRARHRAQLAWVLHLAGRDDEAQAQADAALRLDRANPHREKKLAAETLVDPRFTPTGPVLHRPENAEQTVHHLRNSIVPGNQK